MLNPSSCTQQVTFREQLLKIHLADSTRRTYRTGVRFFPRFGYRYAIDILRLDQSVILLFLAKMFKDGLSLSTVNVYLAAVSNFCTEHDYFNPVREPAVSRAVKGYLRLRGPLSDKRLPVTLPIMRFLKEQLRTSALPLHDQLLFWAAFTSALFGLLRVGEFSARIWSAFDPNVEHTITLRNVILHDDYVTFDLRHSKSSSSSDGQLVYLHATGRSVCPFTAVKRYLRHRYSFRQSSRPLFLLSSGDNLTVGRFFH